MADTNGSMGMFAEDASGVFFEDGLVAELAWAEFIEPVISVEYHYIGASSRAQRYLGAKLDAEIYLGVKLLFP